MPGGDYTIVNTTPVDEQTQLPSEPGAINGGMMQRDDRIPSPVITIDVDAMDDALAEIEARGGTVVTRRTAIPGMGAFAYFTDPEGKCWACGRRRELKSGRARARAGDRSCWLTILTAECHRRFD